MGFMSLVELKFTQKIKGVMFRKVLIGVQLIIYGLEWQKRVLVVHVYQILHSVQLNSVKDAEFSFSREVLRFCNVRRTIETHTVGKQNSGDL